MHSKSHRGRITNVRGIGNVKDANTVQRSRGRSDTGTSDALRNACHSFITRGKKIFTQHQQITQRGHSKTQRDSDASETGSQLASSGSFLLKQKGDYESPLPEAVRIGHTGKRLHQPSPPSRRIAPADARSLLRHLRLQRSNKLMPPLASPSSSSSSARAMTSVSMGAPHLLGQLPHPPGAQPPPPDRPISSPTP